MRRKLHGLALLAISATALFALTATPAEAQGVRHRTNQNSGWYTLPGGSRMYPAPRAYYQFGGTRVYPGRGYNNTWSWTYNSWPYGYPTNFSWPYGAPANYSWPYGQPSNYVWPYGRHR